MSRFVAEVHGASRDCYLKAARKFGANQRSRSRNRHIGLRKRDTKIERKRKTRLRRQSGPFNQSFIPTVEKINDGKKKMDAQESRYLALQTF